MSGELMETYNEYGHIILPSRNKNAINKLNALINAEEELTAESFISPRNLPPPSVITAPLPIPSSAHNSRMKYYRSLQKLSEKKHQTQPQPQRSNLSLKSESRQGRAGAVQSNNDSDHQNDADRDTRRFSDPQYYRSEPIAIPLQSSGFSSSHRFRSALHPRLVVDSSASFVLPAPSYLPTPQRKSYMPFNHQTEDDDNREGTRKKLSKKYQLEDKQFKINRNSRHDDHHDNLSQEEDDDGGFAFEMEL